MLAYGEHERRVEDGAVGADEAGELAVGEPLEGTGCRRGGGGRGGEHEVIEAALPLLRLTRPAVAAEHAHAGLLVATAAAGRRRGFWFVSARTGPDLGTVTPLGLSRELATGLQWHTGLASGPG